MNYASLSESSVPSNGLVQEPAFDRMFAALFDALSLVAYVADGERRLTYRSGGWKRAMGTDPDASGGTSFARALHPDDRVRARAAWQTAHERCVPYRATLRVRSADGSYRWCLDRAEPMDALASASPGWVGTLTDIEDCGLAEAALLDRTRFIERLLDATGDCITVLDFSARVISISPRGRLALGVVDLEAVRGTSWLDVWEADERAAASDAVDAARAGGYGQFTGRSTVPGDDRFWEVGITAMLSAGGDPEALLVVSRDVSETVRLTQSVARNAGYDRLIGAALPGVTWTATPDGLLDYVSDRAVSGSRRFEESLIGSAWLTIVHPDDRADASARWQACVVSGEPFDATFRIRAADDSYRWQLVRALPERDDAGTIVHWVGVNVDIDARVRADEAREMFVALAEASDDLIAAADNDGTHLYMNPAGRALVGAETLAVARGKTLFDLFPDFEVAFGKTVVMPALARSGRWTGDLRIKHLGTGAEIPITYTAFSLASERGRPLGIAMIGRDLRARRRIESNLRALAEAGAAMHRSLAFDATIANVADAVVRSFASFCIVDAYDAYGERRSAVAALAQPDVLPLLGRIAIARKRTSSHPANRAIESGESTLVASVSHEWLESIGMSAMAGDALDRFEIHSVMYVPIRSSRDERIVGSLTYVRAGSDPTNLYTSDDLRFGEEIARRAGTALDNTNAFEHERRIAVTLQEASLPRTLPALDELVLSAEYRPGASEATIGGDWYDAFALPDGRIVITIGDVLGHGLAAAVTMGKVRQAMQSVAMVLNNLSTILTVADRTIRAQSAETYATALVGIFDLARHEFTFASAGHHGPVLRHPDGRVEEVTAYGMMLGLQTDPPETMTIAVPPGTTLAFFTDGLVEATRDIDEGHARVCAAIADVGVARARDAARALVERVLGGSTASDDIAVLVASVKPG